MRPTDPELFAKVGHPKQACLKDFWFVIHLLTPVLVIRWIGIRYRNLIAATTISGQGFFSWSGTGPGRVRDWSGILKWDFALLRTPLFDLRYVVLDSAYGRRFF